MPFGCPSYVPPTLLVPPMLLVAWDAGYIATSPLGTLLTTDMQFIPNSYPSLALLFIFRGLDIQRSKLSLGGEKKPPKKKRGGHWSDQPVAYCPARPPVFSSSPHMPRMGSTFSCTMIPIFDFCPSPSSEEHCLWHTVRLVFRFLPSSFLHLADLSPCFVCSPFAPSHVYWRILSSFSLLFPLRLTSFSFASITHGTLVLCLSRHPPLPLF